MSDAPQAIPTQESIRAGAESFLTLLAAIDRGAKTKRSDIANLAGIMVQQCSQHKILVPAELATLVLKLLANPKRVHAVQPKSDQREVDELSQLADDALGHIAAHLFGAKGMHWRCVQEAIRLEAQHDPDPSGREPSKASAGSIARAVGVTEPTVQSWRKNANYRAMVEARRQERISKPSKLS